MALPDGAVQIMAERLRVSALDDNGFVAVGAPTWTTDSLIKLTLAPQMETGDDIVTKNANGDIYSHFKHGDMTKWFKANLSLATPDPALEQVICGGTLLSDASVALATPGTITATPSITGGVLAAGSYAYKVTACNQYGESVASAEATGVVASGSTGSVGLSITAVTGAAYYRWYGRTAAAEQFIAQTTAASYTDTGAIAPKGALPASNTTAGPGTVGVQAPTLGIVGNPAGVGIECWGKAVLNGVRATYLPYWRWVLPGCKNFVVASRDMTNAQMANEYDGDMFENPNWGTGPFGDWQFDSSKVYQRARASAETLPAVGLASTPATV